MPKKINRNNILFNNQATIEQLNANYHADKDFKLFDFCRIYADGNIKTIGVKPELLETHYTKLLKAPNKLADNGATFLETPRHGKKFSLLLPEQMHTESHLLLQYHGVNNVLTAAYRHDGHIDLVSFQHLNSSATAAADYINHLEYIEQFNRFFIKEREPLLAASDNDIIELISPVKQHLARGFNNSDEEKNQPNRVWQQWCKNFMISPRESACFKLMLQGYNTKQIAKQLAISPRTVECHTIQLRQKTQSPSRAHMIAEFNYLSNSRP